VLDTLESFYGAQQPVAPTDPYEFIVWWHCGYPASDAACSKGWAALREQIGISPEALLRADPAQLARALKPGGMVPELRAQRMKQIAERVERECGGDLLATLHRDPEGARKLLKRFPNISDPGADRILLFAALDAVAAVPSNNPAPLVRILFGKERENYAVTYREAKSALEAELPRDRATRLRAYLLLKKHGEQTCKRGRPKCEQCPLREACAYASGAMRGSAARA
jgi:endonuclease III